MRTLFDMPIRTKRQCSLEYKNKNKISNKSIQTQKKTIVNVPESLNLVYLPHLFQAQRRNIYINKFFTN